MRETFLSCFQSLLTVCLIISVQGPQLPSTKLSELVRMLHPSLLPCFPSFLSLFLTFFSFLCFLFLSLFCLLCSFSSFFPFLASFLHSSLFLFLFFLFLFSLSLVFFFLLFSLSCFLSSIAYFPLFPVLSLSLLSLVFFFFFLSLSSFLVSLLSFGSSVRQRFPSAFVQGGACKRRAFVCSSFGRLAGRAAFRLLFREVFGGNTTPE